MSQNPHWHITLFTLFPEIFPGPLAHSLAGKALKKKIWKFETVNIRDFAMDRHASVDDVPYGGGAGMVLKPDILDMAILSKPNLSSAPLIYLTPRGKPLTQKMVKGFASCPNLRLLCGRYEGVDQRVIEKHKMIEVSIGDYILSGGEMAALVFMDACIRLLPGVVGNQETHVEESFENNLLEYPLYTRPQNWEEKEVPEILRSGNHAKIKAWRIAQSEAITKERRPDLWAHYRMK